MSLDEVYAKLPQLDCKGLCQQSCGPIVMSAAEERRLLEDGLELPTTVDHCVEGKLTCSYLTKHGRCAIYSRRPMICRLWGMVRRMKCHHGCVPVGGFLTDQQAHAFLDAVERV